MKISIGTLATKSHMNAMRSSRRPIEDLSVSTLKDYNGRRPIINLQGCKYSKLGL